MLCRSPFLRDRSGKILRYAQHHMLGVEDKLDAVPFPCGQCLPCRINRRRVWTLRLLLESFFYESQCSFVTLTYSDESLPYTDDYRSTLCLRDVQTFLKRLRKKFYPRQIRYYLVGEYGPKTGRPHYHAILFGLRPYELDAEFLLFQGRSGQKRASVLSNLWNLGLVHVGLASRDSIQYVAGYVTKKFTKKQDILHHEFAVMSRRPGIGSRAVAEIARTLSRHNLQEDFKGQLRIDGKTWPLGRYLLDKLGEEGVKYSGVGDYLNALSVALSKSGKAPGLDYLDFLLSENAQKYKSIESRDKLFNQRDSL